MGLDLVSYLELDLPGGCLGLTNVLIALTVVFVGSRIVNYRRGLQVCPYIFCYCIVPSLELVKICTVDGEPHSWPTRSFHSTRPTRCPIPNHVMECWTHVPVEVEEDKWVNSLPLHP